jgi:hypothetical protein
MRLPSVPVREPSDRPVGQHAGGRDRVLGSPIPDPRFGNMIYPTPSVGCRFGHGGLLNCAVWPFSLDGPLVVASTDYGKYRL